MKKDVFNVWFREFASLVFTQTVQAFLLAAVMSVIVSTASSASAQDQNVGISATGVIAIVALTSISKIERLVKKIFGVESQFGDPSMKNGMGALAGSLIAAKMAGKLLNNVPKIGGAIKGRADGKKDMMKAEQRRARDLGALAKGSPAGTIAQRNMNETLSDQNTVDEQAEADRQSETAQALSQQSGNMSRAVNRGGYNDDYALERLYRIQDKYDESINAAKKKRRDSFYKGLSGLSESAFAVGGAAVGFSISAATGDNMVQGAATGAGVGDMFGQFAVGAAKTAGDIRRDYGSNKKATQKAINEINNTSEKFFGNTKDKVTSINQMVKRTAEIEQEYKKRVDAGNID